MEKLDIIIEQIPEEEYLMRKTSFIADYETYNDGFWGRYIKNPIVGESEWNKIYPEGLKTYREKNGSTLTGFGEQRVIDKINEIVDVLNNLLNIKHEKE